jgi:thioredoxin family protein
MLNIKIFGSTPPCAKCKELEKKARTAASNFPGQVEVTKYDALSEEGDKYGILLTPAIVMGDTAIATGKILSEAEIETKIRQHLEANQ